jgi:Na+/H+ antiporter NhaA
MAADWRSARRIAANQDPYGEPAMPFRHRVRRVLDPLVEFLRIEAVGGGVLLAATIAALALANSPLADASQRLWQHELTVGGLPWDLRHWVNDALMTIFFLVIGLEVNRELTSAGSATPAEPPSPSWAIPMATDPAFAVGVLALLGPRVPAGATAFLLALAVVDDIAAVMGGRHLWGLGALAGIGFTVALFVTDLAYGSVPAIGVDPAKLAILAASLAAGMAGAAVLFGAKSLPTEQPSRQPTDRA